jgi:hypothetical protein
MLHLPGETDPHAGPGTGLIFCASCAFCGRFNCGIQDKMARAAFTRAAASAGVPMEMRK